MAILWENKKISVIERSLLFLKIKNSKMDKRLLIKYCSSILEMGGDLIETGYSLFSDLGHEVESFPLLINIKTATELASLNKDEKHRIVMSWTDYFNLEMRIEIAQRNFSIMLETRLEEMPLLNNKLKKIGSKDLQKIEEIRVMDFDDPELDLFGEYLQQINKDFPKLKIGMAPGNRNKTNTALIIRMLNEGIKLSSIGASFAGAGPLFSDLATEEVLVALRVLYPEANIKGNLNIISEQKKRYEELMEAKIAGQKPIIGPEIFYYESAIHADGIKKNPATYEPFEPEMVGQSRRMFIGKHSGVKSLRDKINEFAFEVKPELLPALQKKISSKSIITAASLEDDCLKEIIKDFVICPVGIEP